MNIFSDYNSLSDKDKKLYVKAVKFLYITMAIAILLFYVMPFCLGFCGEIGRALLLLSYISIYPIFVFGAGLLYYKKFGFHIIVPGALAVFYVPTIFIFYKDLLFLICVFSIFVIGLFGEFTGYLFERRKNSKRQPIGLNRLVKTAESMEKNSSKNNKINKNKSGNKVNNKSNVKTDKSNKKK